MMVNGGWSISGACCDPGKLVMGLLPLTEHTRRYVDGLHIILQFALSVHEYGYDDMSFFVTICIREVSDIISDTTQQNMKEFLDVYLHHNIYTRRP